MAATQTLHSVSGSAEPRTSSSTAGRVEAFHTLNKCVDKHGHRYST